MWYDAFVGTEVGLMKDGIAVGRLGMITTFDAIVLKKTFVPLRKDAKEWFAREEKDAPLIELVIRAEREGFRVGQAS